MNTSLSRVTQRSNGQQAILGLQASQRRLADLQQQMTTGKRISKPSDDPNATFSSLQFRAEQARFTQWSRNAADGLSLMTVADGQLQSMSQQVTRAKSLVLQGATGSMGPVEREAVAAEIDALKESLFTSANFTYLGRPIFGGTSAGSVAFNLSSGAYAGDTNPVTRAAGPQSTVRVDVNGAEAFTSDGTTSGTTIFEALTSIAAHLRTFDATALSADSTTLNQIFDNMSTSMARIGAATNRLESLKSVADGQKLNLTQSISGVEDTDLTKTIVEMNTQQVSYQAALKATANIVQPSLMDFLR